MSKKGKWNSRRLITGAIRFTAYHVTFYWLVSKDAEVEMVRLYITSLTLGSLVFGGYITATDVIERFKT